MQFTIITIIVMIMIIIIMILLIILKDLKTLNFLSPHYTSNKVEATIESSCFLFQPKASLLSTNLYFTTTNSNNNNDNNNNNNNNNYYFKGPPRGRGSPDSLYCRHPVHMENMTFQRKILNTQGNYLKCKNGYSQGHWDLLDGVSIDSLTCYVTR
jgi:hypothetical protein